MSNRRLPVYLLLDCSESMAGPAIQEVQRGMDTLVNTLRGNPQALETAHVSVITFSKYAKQDVPLTDIVQFVPPKLTVRPGTALGAALALLRLRLDKEVRRNSSTQKGDFKPLVFLLTDGQPTDDWEPAAAALKQANALKIANIYAIACGPDADPDSLRQVTDIVLTMPQLSTDAFKKAFIWLSQSASMASTRFGSGDANAPMEMPSLPAGIEVAPPSSGGYRDPRPRQVFLQSRCLRSGKPYLMRFAWQGNRYVAIGSHELEQLDDDDGELLPPINSAELDGCPGCPYCSNPIAGVCSCGAIFCDDPHSNEPVTCPGCRTTLHRGGPSANFDIRRSQG